MPGQYECRKLCPLLMRVFSPARCRIKISAESNQSFFARVVKDRGV
jgi:hypothetical protein